MLWLANVQTTCSSKIHFFLPHYYIISAFASASYTNLFYLDHNSTRLPHFALC